MGAERRCLGHVDLPVPKGEICTICKITVDAYQQGAHDERAKIIKYLKGRWHEPEIAKSLELEIHYK
jgi:hypothetical protein